MSFNIGYPKGVSSVDFNRALKNLTSVIEITKEDAGPCESEGLASIETHYLHAMVIIHCVVTKRGFESEVGNVANALLLMAIKGDHAPGLRYYFRACGFDLHPQFKTEVITMFFEYSNSFRRMAA